MKRMSGIDAAFLYGETPSWHMHISAVLIVDPSSVEGGFSAERFKAITAERLHLVPQFRWRLVEVPLGLDAPSWIEDPDFDIEAHISRIGVPAPGGPEQVGNLIGDLVSIKLDRRKPLWEFWIVEGLQDDKVALLLKVHHCLIDGVSGSELTTILMDLVPDPAPTEPPTEPRQIEAMPNPFELAARGVAHAILTPYRTLQLLNQTVRQGLRFAGLRHQEVSAPTPYMAPRTSFNAELTPFRRFSYTSIPLEDVRAIKNTFGVKVNDVVLAICAGSLCRYLDSRGERPASPLIAQVPVSLRADDDRTDIGAKVGAMFASLATNIADPVERLMAIHESTKSAKEMQKALAAERIMGISEAGPPVLVSLAARMYTAAGLDVRTPPMMNLIISNVPGPPFALYCAGAKIESIFPMGPLLYGTGINITVFSYIDQIGFGFMVCRDLVSDPWALANSVSESLDELKAAAKARA